jgi:hypothetical protein
MLAPRPYEGPAAIAASSSQSEPVVAAAAETSPPAEERAAEPPVEPTPEPQDDRTWMVGAFIDTGYVFNSNLPDNHVNRGNGTAPRTGEFTVPLAVAQVRHDASEREPWSLELALQFGPAATALAAADPQPGGDGSRLAGATVWQHISRANVGGRIPRAGTEIAAGVFTTPIGYWSFWPKDNWLYSTPWHLNGVPYVLMGARVLQPVGKRVVLQAWVFNGYQTYADINKVPSYMAGAIVTPVDGLQLGHFEYFGAEDLDPKPRAWRLLSDTWVNYEGERFGIGGVFDVIRERLTLVPGEPIALTISGSIVPRVKLLDRKDGNLQWALAARGEAYWDRDGRIFGVRQLLGSASLGSDVRLWKHLTVRAEYRYDRTTNRDGFFYRGAAVNDDDDGLGREQHTVFAMLSGSFEHWFRTRRKP